MSSWEDAPNQGALSFADKTVVNDARLQQVAPAWPTGGTYAQMQNESSFDPNAVSPTGAQGIAQFEPSTTAAINKQNGTKLDPNNPDDALELHYQLTKQLLTQYGGDPVKALKAYNAGTDQSKWNNPETNAYVSKIGSQIASSNSGGWQDAPTQPAASPTAAWEDAPDQGTPPPSDPNSLWSNVKGGALAAADLGTGILSAIPAGIGAVGSAIANGSIASGVQTGGKVMDALSAHNLLGDVGINTDNAQASPAFQDAGKATDFLFNTIPNTIGKGVAMEGLSDAGLNPISDYDPKQGEDLSNILKLGMMASPLAEVPHLISGRMSAGADLARQQEQAKLAGSAEPVVPTTPVDMDDMLTQADRANMQQQSDNIGQHEADLQDTVQQNIQAQRDQAQTEALGINSDANTSDANAAGQGDLFTPQPKSLDQLRQEYNYDLQPSGTQSDLFSDNNNAVKPYDQYAGEQPVPLTRPDFEQAVDSLSKTEGTRFSVPDDMDTAYEQYLKTTSDDQGNLFDRPTMAQNFVDLAKTEAVSRYVEDHPIVKANQAKVDTLTDQLQQIDGSQQPGPFDKQLITQKTAQLTDATKTLETSKTNIGNMYEKGVQAPYVKDGITYLNSGLPLPDWIKNGLAKLLQGLHGLVFKNIDRKLSGPKNIDGIGGLIKAGIADQVNKQASKVWETKPNEMINKTITKIPGISDAVKEFNPKDTLEASPEQLKATMSAAPDVSDGISAKIQNNIAQGGLMLTNLTKNPIVKFVAETVDHATTNATQYVKNELTAPKTGLRSKMMVMSKTELTGIRSLMETAEGQREYTPAELAKMGYNDKQIDYYNKSRELDQQAFDQMNQGLKTAGLPPVDSRIGHIAGQFMGDFKKLITDKTGKVIAVIPGNTKYSVEAISKHFMDTHPDAANLNVGKTEYIPLRENSGAADTRFESFMQTVNYLKSTNVDIGHLVDSMNTFFSQDASKLMQMSRFAKDKQKVGVIGAEGRKTWQSAEKNATDGAKAQLKYLESMTKWSEMQTAAAKAKTFLTDKDLVENKPNAVKLAGDYLDSSMGRNRGAIQHVMNAGLNTFAETTGLGPSVLRGWNNNVKTAMLAKFVGVFKLSHSLVTLSQPLQALPALDSLLKARGADIGPKAQSISMLKAINSSTNIWKAHFGVGELKDPFEIAADKYRMANGVFDVNMSNHLSNVTSPGLDKARHIGELNISVPEAGARSFTFMYYSHMLKDLGLDAGSIFPTARNLMRYAMVDYNPHERPMVFGKMGILGDIASTLTRFKFNQLSQHMVAAGEIEKSIKPLLTILGTSAMLGGVRGIFAYGAANEVVKAASNLMAKLNMISQPTSLDEILLKSLHGANKTAADMLNWGAYAGVGLNLTGSFTNSDIIPSDPLSSLVPYGDEVSKMASSAWNLATKPNSTSLKQAAVAYAPNSVKGIAENALFTSSKVNPDGTRNFTNPTNLELEARRTPTDMAERALSFRPLQESKNAFISQVQKGKDDQQASVSGFLFDKAKSEYQAQGGRLTPQQWQQYSQRDLQLGGNDFQTEFMKYLTTGVVRDRLERAQGIPSSGLPSLYKYQNINGMK